MNILGIYFPIHSSLTYKFLSGGERHFVEVFRRIKNASVLTTSLGAMILDAENLNVGKLHVFSVPLAHVLHQPRVIRLWFVSLFYMLGSILAAFRIRERFDFICSSTHHLHEVLPAVILRRRNMNSKLGVYIHLLEPLPFTRARQDFLLPSFLVWLSQNLSFLLLKRYTDLLFVYPSEKDALRNYGFPNEKIKIVRSGIDLEKINEVKTVGEQYDACFLARLAPHKGIFDIVKAWKKVCQNLPYRRIAIIGSGLEIYVSELRDMIRMCGLERNIVMLGNVGEEKKYSVLKLSRVFLFPSYMETVPIAVCEAMACGLPVVAYDLPFYEVFGEHCIVKTPVGDVSALAENVSKLLRDENLRRTMSEKAKAVARRFDWNKITKKEIAAILRA